ncbi:MAG TPA: NAD(P)/FAD-dependent oxidoreductase [Actinomycetes bacterium]|nr:NAD(P)/FAD-dependent oxidoreductase [Actinomycetes bacterium]
MDNFDVVVMGAGSAGLSVARKLAAEGKSVSVVESRRVGGECPYTACIPSKAMLRSAQVRSESKRAVVLGAASLPPILDSASAAFARAVERRDQVVDQRDDGEAAKSLENDGVTLIRGHARIARAGVVCVEESHISYTDLVVTTGSQPVIPPINGISEVPVWTSDEALSTNRSPESLVVIGGGPVGCELSQIFARFDCPTTLIEPANQLLGQEDPTIAAVLAGALTGDGVNVRLGVQVLAARQLRDPARALLSLNDGSNVEAERVLIATGRRPSTGGLNLDKLAIELQPDGSLTVDDNCKVVGQSHVWAAGDVTAIAPYTHTANYQAKIVVAGILGSHWRAQYNAIPRAVYTDPAVASVGMNSRAAGKAGINWVSAAVDLSSVARSTTDSAPPGRLVVTANRDESRLIGAAAIGPHADEWLAEAALAISAKIPLHVLAQAVHAFPTFGEAFELAVQQLTEA